MADAAADRPRVAITMGDAAGIGPEIIVKTLADGRVADVCVPIVLGDARVLERAMDVARLRLPIRTLGSAADAEGRPGVLDMPTSSDTISLDGEATARSAERISWSASRKASVDSAPWFSFARSA